MICPPSECPRCHDIGLWYQVPRVAVLGLQLGHRGTAWQGLGGRVWKLKLGLLKEEGPWHKPCLFSGEGAAGKHG